LGRTARVATIRGPIRPLPQSFGGNLVSGLAILCASLLNPMHARRWIVVVCSLLLGIGQAGCGTTRYTDTARTATEQLLISDAVDRAVSDINFRVLAGRTVFFDPQYLKFTNPVYNFDDNHYLISTLRQHLLASGCVLKEKREDAEIIVEARAGAVGTDRHDLLYGVPATNLGTTVAMPGVPAAIPEIPFAKRTNQRGVAKLAVFAYHRESGEPLWQSGTSQYSSNAKNLWVLGIGPFQSGTIYRGTTFAGKEIPNPLAMNRHPKDDRPVWVSKEAEFGDGPDGEPLPGAANVAAANPPAGATTTAAAASAVAKPAPAASPASAQSATTGPAANASAAKTPPPGAHADGSNAAKPGAAAPQRPAQQAAYQEPAAAAAHTQSSAPSSVPSNASPNHAQNESPAAPLDSLQGRLLDIRPAPQ
jgi:hypothetical protein